MDTIDLHGVRYEKVSIAAKAAGYTPDYVGQLCRAKKIKAELIGRTWYVQEGTLQYHRKQKARLNTAKTSKEMGKTLNEMRQSHGKERTGVYIEGVTPEYRKHLLSVPISYERDERELMPGTRNAAGSSVAKTAHKENNVKIAVENDKEEVEQVLTPEEDRKNQEPVLAGSIKVVEHMEDLPTETAEDLTKRIRKVDRIDSPERVVKTMTDRIAKLNKGDNALPSRKQVENRNGIQRNASTARKIGILPATMAGLVALVVVVSAMSTTEIMIYEKVMQNGTSSIRMTKSYTLSSSAIRSLSDIREHISF